MEDWKKRLYDSYVSTGQASQKLPANNIKGSEYFKRVIKKHIPSDNTIAIADLGCGHGTLLHNLKEMGYSNIIGIDTSKEQITLANELGISEAKHLDIDVFLQEHRSFDVIFMMDILEHLSKQEVIEILDQVNYALKDDAFIIMHVPNAEGLFGMRMRYGDFTHELAFTARSIQQILRACNFHSIACYEDKPIIHNIKSFIRHVIWRVLTFPYRLLFIAETGNTKNILSQNMLVVARKKSFEL